MTAVRVPGRRFWIYKAFGWIHATTEDHDCFGRWQSSNEDFRIRSRWPGQGVNSQPGASHHCEGEPGGKKVGENRRRQLVNVEDSRNFSFTHSFTPNPKSELGGILLLCNLISVFYSIILKVFFEYLLFITRGKLWFPREALQHNFVVFCNTRSKTLCRHWTRHWLFKTVWGGVSGFWSDTTSQSSPWRIDNYSRLL